ncbi:Os05g0253400 [Oryza sativa Japonica Group]|uniref:Os05g0253400 protein n=1 Tax=Oryza sativa subsp. japonica TaxID=39947 RepID=A0A0N7KKF1_ORYSJ|nr:Os05g0253400 [Oryza sativa Japonica Group]
MTADPLASGAGSALPTATAAAGPSGGGIRTKGAPEADSVGVPRPAASVTTSRCRRRRGAPAAARAGTACSLHPPLDATTRSRRPLSFEGDGSGDRVDGGSEEGDEGGGGVDGIWARAWRVHG